LSEKPSDYSEMSELAFASKMLRERVSPPGRAQFVETRIRAAARDLRWNFSRAKDVWYADPRVSLKPCELRKVEELSGVKYGREEINEIDALISKANSLSVAGDTDFASAFVAAVRAFTRAVDRSRAERNRG
jgi:hypothetical protein